MLADPLVDLVWFLQILADLVRTLFLFVDARNTCANIVLKKRRRRNNSNTITKRSKLRLTIYKTSTNNTSRSTPIWRIFWRPLDFEGRHQINHFWRKANTKQEKGGPRNVWKTNWVLIDFDPQIDNKLRTIDQQYIKIDPNLENILAPTGFSRSP